MIEIVNQQRKIKINPQMFVEIAEKAIRSIAAANGKTTTIAFVSDSKMRRLNGDFRGQKATTDVLSFPFEADEFSVADNIGDIVISVEQAARQAAENNLSLETEISQLILHGILHLCGYDHETDHGKMNVLELELRDKLNIQ